MNLIIILAVIALFAVILFISYTKIYNQLVQVRNNMQSAWSNIDVQLKRRFDLIPNLVEVAKKYMDHEADVLINLTRARSGLDSARGSDDVGKQLKAENKVGGALANFAVTMEAYPDLKADTHMAELQGELTETENNIASFRQRYNNAVLSNNNSVQKFPANIIAGMFKFENGEFFEVTAPEEREAPKVQF